MEKQIKWSTVDSVKTRHNGSVAVKYTDGSTRIFATTTRFLDAHKKAYKETAAEKAERVARMAVGE